MLRMYHYISYAYVCHRSYTHTLDTLPSPLTRILALALALVFALVPALTFASLLLYLFHYYLASTPPLSPPSPVPLVCHCLRPCPCLNLCFNPYLCLFISLSIYLLLLLPLLLSLSLSGHTAAQSPVVTPKEGGVAAEGDQVQRLIPRPYPTHTVL